MENTLLKWVIKVSENGYWNPEQAHKKPVKPVERKDAKVYDNLQFAIEVHEELIDLANRYPTTFPFDRVEVNEA